MTRTGPAPRAPFLLLVLAVALSRCSASPDTSGRVVLERLLSDAGAPSRPGVVPPETHLQWSVEEILSDWQSDVGEDSVTFASPPLAIESLDEVDSIVVSFTEPDPTERVRVVLLWSTEPSLSRADFLRNRRTLRPGEEGSARIRAKELRAYAGAPLRHLYLHLEGRSEPSAVIASIAVVTLAERLAAQAPAPAAGTGTGTGIDEVRVMADGEMRDALYLRPGARERAPRSPREDVAVPEGAVLRFGLHAEAPTNARLDIIADGVRETLFDGMVRGSGWRDVELSLPPASRAFFELETDGGGPLFWSEPMVLAPSRASPTRPNVILYVVDSLRADVLGLYGGEAGTSPFLDELSARGLVFERCYAAASWTKPSVASLLTSLYPSTHRLGSRHYTDPLPDRVPTLADYFGEAGYVTAQFTANPFSGTLSNLDRGFDRYFAPDAFVAGTSADATRVSAEALSARILPWLEEHAGDRFLLYVQSVDPHPPFTVPGETEAAEAVSPVEAYRGAVRANDAQIARLYQKLETLGIASDTLLVVTSDHGEAFGAHGKTGHGQSVYEEEIRVPLILHWPRNVAPARSAVVAEHVDVLPTLLDLASIPFDDDAVEGRRLTGATRDGGAGPDAVSSRFVYPEDIDLVGVDRTEAHAVIDFPWKLVVTEVEEGGVELFDLSADPFEQADLAGKQPERVLALRVELQTFFAERAVTRARLFGSPAEGREGVPARPPSPLLLEQLRALGYLR